MTISEKIIIIIACIELLCFVAYALFVVVVWLICLILDVERFIRKVYNKRKRG